MITVEAQLSYDQLLEAVGRLSPAELETLQKQIAQLRSPQRTDALPKQEAELLLNINSLPLPQADARYQELLAKRQEGELTESEHQELITLSDHHEQQNAERVKYLVQLATLKRMTLADLMDQLEIPQPSYGKAG